MSNVRLSDQSIAATWLDAGTTGNFIAIAALGVALLLNAPNPHAQATRSLNGAATVFSGASAFFPPRVERDTARGRIWTLNEDMVLLYDGRTRTLVKKIALAGWSSVSEPNSCPADLAVDVAGHVIVSSNIAPTLWRINAETLDAERLDIALDADNDEDVGFTGLLSASRDSVYAVSAIHGSLWRIDLNSRRGTKLQMAMPLKGACALGFAPQTGLGRSHIHTGLAPTALLCASTMSGSRRIEISGLTQATLTHESCSTK